MKQSETQFIIYRNGPPTLAQRIEAAIPHFKGNHKGALPAAVVVHPTNLVTAMEIIKNLGVILPVASNGGVSSVECWLQVTEGK